MSDEYAGPDRRNPPGCETSRSECLHGAAIASKAADLAVKEVFAILGVDVTKPDQVAEFQEDLRFGRKLRRIADHGAMAFFGAAFVAMAAALWVGITSKMGVR